MGFLNLLSKRDAKPAPMTILRLPTGTFTVDAHGKVVASTLPHSFPPSYTSAISRVILQVFRTAGECALGLTELNIEYPLLRLTARELRGGAIIFLAPRPIQKT